MFPHPTKKHLTLVSAALALTLVGVFVAPLALARITVNTIDPVAVVTDNGQHIIVTGPVVVRRASGGTSG
jgi:hypothetical protein